MSDHRYHPYGSRTPSINPQGILTGGSGLATSSRSWPNGFQSPGHAGAQRNHASSPNSGAGPPNLPRGPTPPAPPHRANITQPVPEDGRLELDSILRDVQGNDDLGAALGHSQGLPDSFNSMSPAGDLHPSGSGYLIAPLAITQMFTDSFRRAGLDDKHHGFGLQLCDSLGQPAAVVEDIVMRLKFNQDIHHKLDLLLTAQPVASVTPVTPATPTPAAAPANPTSAPKAGPELNAFLLEVANRYVIEGAVGGYTANEDGDGPIMTSLFNEILRQLMEKGQNWRDRVIGKTNWTYQPETREPDGVVTAIGNKGRAARSKLSTTVLLYVHIPNRVAPPDLNIPKLDFLIYNVRKDVIRGPNGLALTREEIVAQTPIPDRARLAFLRLLLVEYYHDTSAQYKGQSNWAVVDAKVGFLNRQDARYRHCFATLCLQDDAARFTGERTWAQVVEWMAENGQVWQLPNEARLAAALAAMNARWADRTCPEDALFEHPMPAGVQPTTAIALMPAAA